MYVHVMGETGAVDKSRYTSQKNTFTFAGSIAIGSPEQPQKRTAASPHDGKSPGYSQVPYPRTPAGRGKQVGFLWVWGRGIEE